MLDIKIDGATVIDGTGRPGSRTDIGISDDTIVAVGDLSRETAGQGAQRHRAQVVAPGFIDMHSHSDWRLWGNRRAESKIRQGVTTEVVGNCGFSPAPVSTEFLDDLRGFALYIPTGMDFAWRSVGEYLQAFDRDGTALNVDPARGPRHPPHRRHGLRAPPAHRRRADSSCSAIMGDAMDEGAWGLSTGLIYAPGSCATTDEIIAVAQGGARATGASTPATSAEKAPHCSTRFARRSASVARRSCRCR